MSGRAPRRARWLRRTAPQTGVGDEVWHVVAQGDAEPLPFDSEHPVALEIPERAVVSDELETVVRSLEGTTGTVSAVSTVADVGGEERHPFLVPEAAHPPRGVALGAVELGKTRCDQHLLFPVRVEVEQGDFGGRLVGRWPVGACRLVGPQLRHHARVSSRVAARYADHAPPRSATSTRWRNDGITLRNSSSIASAYWRASGSGCARMRSSNCS